MKLTWNDPREILPNQKQLVAVVIKHWKQENVRSCEIIIGEVEYNNDLSHVQVQTNDDTGKGSYAVNLKGGDSSYDDIGLAWIDVKHLNLPSWIFKNDL